MPDTRTAQQRIDGFNVKTDKCPICSQWASSCKHDLGSMHQRFRDNEIDNKTRKIVQEELSKLLCLRK